MNREALCGLVSSDIVITQPLNIQSSQLRTADVIYDGVVIPYKLRSVLTTCRQAGRMVAVQGSVPE
jgi:hypothetical protein